MKDKFYRIMKVANGWMLEPYHPEFGPIAKEDTIYIFTSSKKLAKFIEKLDEETEE